MSTSVGIDCTVCSATHGYTQCVDYTTADYWSYWWLYEPSESTGSEPVIYRTHSFPFFTVYHHVDILGLNELLFLFPPMLELQHRQYCALPENRDTIQLSMSYLT